MAPPEIPITIPPMDDASANVFSLSDRKLSVSGVTLLSEVPDNVTFSSFSSLCDGSDAPEAIIQRVRSRLNYGGFLGFTKEAPSETLMNSLGRFGNRNFLSVFRFKTWWSTEWVGKSGSDLQTETQWLLLDVPELSSYVLILPMINGKFRSALHPGEGGQVMISAESGSTQVRTSSLSRIAYVHFCDNPYTLMKEAYSAARVHLNTFRLLEEKPVSSLVNKFGWCTWDAFYLAVEPIGIWYGLKEFYDAGLSVRFLIIDDGWQSITTDGKNPNEDLVLGGSQMTSRLYRFEECNKFRNYIQGTLLGPNAPSFDTERLKALINKAIEIEQVEKARDRAIESGASDITIYKQKIKELTKELNEIKYGTEQSIKKDDQRIENCGREIGLKGFIMDLRTMFKGLDDIYVWQALCGAWGGVTPDAIPYLNTELIPVTSSTHLDLMMTDLAVVRLVEGGIGLVHPDQAVDLYESMHSYLAGIGVTGVKVDVIHSLEYVCENFGGRVELAKTYYNGITKSLNKNFNGTGLISSMQQCNDFFFLGTSQISMGRVGDDFWFQDPSGDPMGVYWLQGVHMVHCAYNSMWIGQIIQPDWDMFQSDHLCAKFHAGSRAICGGPIYVSDSVGGHDFGLIQKLVFPDGTIPKCEHFALPTRDCLFKSPLLDGETVLKIWNLNKFGGVIGAFNCQGAGWDPDMRRIRGYSKYYKSVSGKIHVTDIEWDQNNEASLMGNAKEYALYFNQTEKLQLVTPKSNAISITIAPSSFEILSYVPIKKLSPVVKFAPIGLTNMFNSVGTLLALEYTDVSGVKIKIKGGGKFLSYSSERPKEILLNGAKTNFEYLEDGRLTLELLWDEENCGVSGVEIAY